MPSGRRFIKYSQFSVSNGSEISHVRSGKGPLDFFFFFGAIFSHAIPEAKHEIRESLCWYHLMSHSPSNSEHKKHNIRTSCAFSLAPAYVFAVKKKFFLKKPCLGFGPNIEVTIPTGVGFLSRTSERHSGRRGWLCVFFRIWVFFPQDIPTSKQHRTGRSGAFAFVLHLHGNEAAQELGSPRLCNGLAASLILATINTPGDPCQK